MIARFPVILARIRVKFPSRLSLEGLRGSQEASGCASRSLSLSCADDGIIVRPPTFSVSHKGLAQVASVACPMLLPRVLCSVLRVRSLFVFTRVR